MNSISKCRKFLSSITRPLYLFHCRFFLLMGTIFGFVSSDLQDKVNIIKNYLKNSETSKHFTSAKQMIEYEKANELLKKNGYVSGSRTLLRLHRGLEFIHHFLDKLKDLKGEDYTSCSCREAYDATLARHHSWYIRTGAKMAMHALPNREQLFVRVCGDVCNIQTQLDVLPKTLEAISQIHSRIDSLYTLHDLHSLPWATIVVWIITRLRCAFHWSAFVKYQIFLNLPLNGALLYYSS